MVLAVIPSRFDSTRFPGKALISVAGVPLVVRVARAVCDAAVADQVLVATDDERIAVVVRAAGFAAHLDAAPRRTGSDRVAAAAAAVAPAAAIVLNVQGDEPLLDAAALRGALAALADAGGNDLGTIAAVITDPAVLRDPDAVQVEVDERGRAVAFARGGAVAFARGGAVAAGGRGSRPSLLHLGVYAFRGEALARFAALPTAVAEEAARLEQLRALAHGLTIGVRIVEAPGAAVNRPADLPRVEALARALDRRRETGRRENSGREKSTP